MKNIFRRTNSKNKVDDKDKDKYKDKDTDEKEQSKLTQAKPMQKSKTIGSVDQSSKKKATKDQIVRSQTSTINSTMAPTAAATNRLQALIQMRANHGQNDRAKSVNVSQSKEKKLLANRAQKTTPTQSQDDIDAASPRHYSLIHNEKKNKKDEIKIDHDNHRINYRVKNEVFSLYEYYQPVKILGSGAYAVVCEAIDTRNGNKVAVKKNKGVFDDLIDARRILREIKVLMHFSHKDIIDLIDVIPPVLSDIETFNDVYLVMPKMETTLAKVIRSKQKLTDKHFQFFLYQMLRGLKYMHSAGVIHRDLKPENILINGSDCNLKITDFGLARGVSKEENIEQPTVYVVTRWYRSPEVMCSAGFYDEKVDIWSVGCIFAELLQRRPAFMGQNYLDQLKLIFDVMGTPTDFSWIKTPEAKKWIQKQKPKPPQDLAKMFSNASQSALDLLKKMLVLDPAKRISAEESLTHPYLAKLHKAKEEIDCPLFDLSFEFENAIKTKFGVRHMMYEALSDYKKIQAKELAMQNNNENNNKNIKYNNKNNKDNHRGSSKSKTKSKSNKSKNTKNTVDDEKAHNE